MTFILTALSVSPRREPRIASSALQVEEAVQDADAWARAGNISGLCRYLEVPVSGRAYHVLQDEGDGYKRSNFFFPYPDDGEQAVALVIPDTYRGAFDRLLRELDSASAEQRVLLIAEENGNVTSLDQDDAGAGSVDVLGPMTIAELWRRHDLGEVLEDSVVIIEEPSG